MKKRLTKLLFILTFLVLNVGIVGAQQDKTITVGGVSFKMIYVQGGTFQMGGTFDYSRQQMQLGLANVSEAEKQTEDFQHAYQKAMYKIQKRESFCLPAHKVTLSSYFIGETEVTQGLWKAVMGDNPSIDPKGWYNYGIGDNYPVYNVSWDDCQRFVEKLSGMSGKKFRLPTEAEWEFAARGGLKSKGYKCIGSNNHSEIGWLDEGLVGGRTRPVKGKLSNELGIYDMGGNVEEWCNDWFGEDYYANSPVNNPQGPATSSDNYRVCRGGSFCVRVYDVCARGASKAERKEIVGLRLVLEVQ